MRIKLIFITFLQKVKAFWRTCGRGHFTRHEGGRDIKAKNHCHYLRSIINFVVAGF